MPQLHLLRSQLRIRINNQTTANQHNSLRKVLNRRNKHSRLKNQTCQLGCLIGLLQLFQNYLRLKRHYKLQKNNWQLINQPGNQENKPAEQEEDPFAGMTPDDSFNPEMDRSEEQPQSGTEPEAGDTLPEASESDTIPKQLLVRLVMNPGCK